MGGQPSKNIFKVAKRGIEFFQDSSTARKLSIEAQSDKVKRMG